QCMCPPLQTTSPIIRPPVRMRYCNDLNRMQKFAVDKDVGKSAQEETSRAMCSGRPSPGGLRDHLHAAIYFAQEQDGSRRTALAMPVRGRFKLAAHLRVKLDELIGHRRILYRDGREVPTRGLA